MFVIVLPKAAVTATVTVTFHSLIAISDAMPIYKYCKCKGITPFIDLNEKQGIKVRYKDKRIFLNLYLSLEFSCNTGIIIVQYNVMFYGYLIDAKKI